MSFIIRTCNICFARFDASLVDFLFIGLRLRLLQVNGSYLTIQLSHVTKYGVYGVFDRGFAWEKFAGSGISTCDPRGPPLFFISEAAPSLVQSMPSSDPAKLLVPKGPP